MKKLFAILIMCSLSLPVLAEEVPANESPSENVMETLSEENFQDVNNVEVPQEQDLSAIPEELPSGLKEPVSKKKLAKKFLIAMLCVAGTAVFLYGILSIYNKIRSGFTSDDILPPEGDKPLDTPEDLTEAVKTFVEKTKWYN